MFPLGRFPCVLDVCFLLSWSRRTEIRSPKPLTGSPCTKLGPGARSLELRPADVRGDELGENGRASLNQKAGHISWSNLRWIANQPGSQPGSQLGSQPASQPASQPGQPANQPANQPTSQPASQTGGCSRWGFAQKGGPKRQPRGTIFFLQVSWWEDI